ERLPELDPARVTTIARRVAHRVAPQQAAAQAGRNRRTRTVEVSPGPDGTTTWWALLPSEGSAVAWSAVRTLAQDYQRSDPSLSIDQARADAMVDLMLQRVTVTADVTLGVPVLTTLDGTQCDPLVEAAAEGPEAAEGGAHGTGATGEVVELDTVTDHDTGEVVEVAHLAPGSSRELAGVAPGWFSGEPGWDLATVMAPTSGGVAVSGCHIPGVGWVEAGTVAGILSTVPLVVSRALLDAATGTLVETTAAAYSPSPSIRRHVQTRDGTCRMWGCTRPIQQCDLDHTRPWPAGSTTPGNLAGLCRRHHRMKQRARWRYTLAPDGTVTWMSPQGAKRVTLPDHAVWPPRGRTPDPSAGTLGGQAVTDGAREPRKTPDRSPVTPPF
ncbi:MAG: HNH endonuclease signature motif containing protein, partial [Ornithinibacter sp.]